MPFYNEWPKPIVLSRLLINIDFAKLLVKLSIIEDSMDSKCLQNAQSATEVFDALSHPTRLLIVCLLLDREHYVQELFDRLGTTKGNISQHLRILEQAGHITSRKEANRVYYSIADERLRTLVKTIQKLYCPGLSVH